MLHTKLPKILRQRLAAFGRRRRRMMVWRAGGWALLLILLGGLLVAAVDSLFQPGEDLQYGLAVAVYLVGLGVFYQSGIRHFFHPLSQVELARKAERAVAGKLAERLSAAVELSAAPPPGVSGWMINRTVVLATREFVAVEPHALVNPAPANRVWRRVRIPATICVFFLLFPVTRALLLRAFIPGINVARPSAILLHVEPGDVQLATGTALNIRVKTNSRALPVVELNWEDGLAESLPPPKEHTAYSLRLPPVTQGFLYRVCVADARSRWYRVEVKTPPRVTKMTLTITPPAYTGEPVRILKTGDADVLAGSVVEFDAVIQGPKVRSARLIRSAGVALPMTMKDGRARTQLTLHQNIQYGVRLERMDGVSADPEQEWRLRVTPDEPPVLTLVGAGLDAGLAGQRELLRVSMNAKDDRGLTSLDLRVQRGGKSPFVRSLTLATPKQRQFQGKLTVDLAALAVPMGETISVSLCATDSGGQAAESKPLELLIVAGEPLGSALIAKRLRTSFSAFMRQVRILKRERQTWAQLARSFRPEDALAYRGTILVAEARLDAVRSAVQKTSAVFMRESVKLNPETGKLAYSFGAHLSAWANDRGRMLQGIVRRTHLAADGQGGAEAVRSAHDLVTLVSHEITKLGRRAGLLVAVVEGRGLVKQADAAFLRQGRMVPVVQGLNGWRVDSPRAKEGRQSMPVDGKNRALLVQRMREVSPDLVSRAEGRLRYDIRLLSGVPNAIGRMAEDTALAELEVMLTKASVPAEALLNTLPVDVTQPWSFDLLMNAGSAAKRLRDYARQAKDLVWREMKKQFSHVKPPAGEIARLARTVKRIQQQAKAFQTVAKGHSKTDQVAMRNAALRVMRAEVSHLRRRVKEAREMLRRQALALPPVVLERQQSYHTLTQLDEKMDQAFGEVKKQLTLANGKTKAIPNAFNHALEMINQKIVAAVRYEKKADELAVKRLAREALATQRQLTQKNGREKSTPPPAIQEKFAAQLNALTDAMRRVGKYDAADNVRQKNHQREQRKDAIQSLGKLLARAAGNRQSPENWRMGDDLKQAAKRIENEPTGSDHQAKERLADLGIKITLTADSVRQRGKPDEARAYAHIREDLSQLVEAETPIRAARPAVEKLAERLSAIEKHLGEKAYRAELTAARASEEVRQSARLTVADTLDQLAQKSRQAAAQRNLAKALIDELTAVAAQRKPFSAGKLEKSAQANLTRINDSNHLAETALAESQKLQVLSAAAQKIRQEENAVRAQFAKRETQIAAELRRIQINLSTQKNDLKKLNKTRQKTLAQVNKQLALAAAEIQKLSQRGTALANRVPAPQMPPPRKTVAAVQSLLTQADQIVRRANQKLDTTAPPKDEKPDQWQARMNRLEQAHRLAKESLVEAAFAKEELTKAQIATPQVDAKRQHSRPQKAEEFIPKKSRLQAKDRQRMQLAGARAYAERALALAQKADQLAGGKVSPQPTTPEGATALAQSAHRELGRATKNVRAATHQQQQARGELQLANRAMKNATDDEAAIRTAHTAAKDAGAKKSLARALVTATAKMKQAQDAVARVSATAQQAATQAAQARQREQQNLAAYQKQLAKTNALIAKRKATPGVGGVSDNDKKLVAAARQEADVLAAKIVAPLAAEFHDTRLLTYAKNARETQAARGKSLARLVGEQRAAADELADLGAHRQALQKSLEKRLTAGMDRARAMQQQLTGTAEAIPPMPVSSFSGSATTQAANELGAKVAESSPAVALARELARLARRATEQAGKLSRGAAKSNAPPHTNKLAAGGEAQPQQTKREITARNAAGQALAQIERAPKQAAAYRAAADQLAQAAGQLRAGRSRSGSPSRRSPSTRSAATRNPGTRGSGKGGMKTSATSGRPAGLAQGQAKAGRDGAGWARLSARMRKQIRAGGVEQFAEEYQLVIRAYLRKLSEEE